MGVVSFGSFYPSDRDGRFDSCPSTKLDKVMNLRVEVPAGCVDAFMGRLLDLGRNQLVRRHCLLRQGQPTPAAAGRKMGRVPLLNIVDDVTIRSCSFRPPQEGCSFEEGDRTSPGLDYPETA